MKIVLSALAALSLAFSASAPAVAETSTVKAPEPVWAFEDSDLPVDPGFRFGRLDNGLRYVIRRNDNPAATGEVRLLVDAGSIAESESERGYAHFIEHMAFNGSTKVPEGDMIKLLEREGLAFGADTNASTSFDYTLYMLDLPRSDPALLDTALMLMRETASELKLDQAAIDREKGVVLSEKRVRDTYALRNVIARFNFLYPGARFADRMPIGTSEALQGATSDKLRALYARTYTPENSAIVVVGDFDPDVVEREIKEHFASWVASPTPDDPVAGPLDAALEGKTEIYVDPALSERVTASRNAPWIDEKDTAETRARNLLSQIGYGIVNRRFERLANGENPPFRGAGFGASEVFEAGRTTNLVVDSAEGEWQKGLATVVAEYRRALAYGFSDGEVAEQLANIRTSLENAVASADTRYNSTFTGAAIELLQDGTVPTTPQSTLERFEAALPNITPDTVLAAMVSDAAPLDDPLLRFEGRKAPEGGADALRAAWNAAVTATVERGSDLASGTFGYTDFGTPGTVASDTVDPRMGIREIRFANGVRLNLKHTDLRKDRISYELNLDGGDLLNTKANPLATALVGGMPLGGLGKHTYDELQSILAGKSVGFSISSGDETFRMAGTTTQRDLELQLDLLAASITDPGWRTQGEERFRRSVYDWFASMNATPNSALNTALGGIVSDNDPRFTVQPIAGYLAVDYAKLKTDIGDRLANGAIEIALVGDIDEDATIALVGKTLGALPPREPDFRNYAENRTRSFTPDRAARTVNHTGEADQALLNFIWPTRDDSDPLESLELSFLERVLQIELTDTLREKLGQTYSPSANAGQSRIYKGYGTFSVGAALDVKDVPAARQAVIDTIAALRTTPVDDDTLLRARRPMLESYDNALKTNGGWMGMVDRAQTESDRIDRFLAAKARVESITAKDLQEIAVRYLDPAQRLEVIALPGAKAE